MTNRDKFNACVRAEAEEQIAYWESMSDRDLVNYFSQESGAQVSVHMPNVLNYFMVQNTPRNEHPEWPDGIIEWLGREAKK